MRQFLVLGFPKYLPTVLELMQPLPRDVKMALELLRADPARDRSIDELAAAAGVKRRTLEKHFRRFLCRTPVEVRRDLRLERARRDLLRAQSGATVTEIALRCGFNHFGRFAALYRARYGESPSATLGRSHHDLVLGGGGGFRLSLDRPAVSVSPFHLVGNDARASPAIAEEIAARLCRNCSLAVTEPGHARYHLHGNVRADPDGRLRLMVWLIDAATRRYIWADRWDGDASESFEFEERVASCAAISIERSVRSAEIDRACRKHPDQLNAWELTMRAMPRALSMSATPLGEALELLEQAMELAPTDALPIALAAWCHGQRGSKSFTARSLAEKQRARELAGRAAELDTGDPVATALLASAYTLAHDLPAAAIHFQRALAIDGGCVWAWNRSGWVSVYRGEVAEAIDRFQIARAIAPDDPLNFFCSIGIASAHFGAGRYDEAARWFSRGIAEHPSAIWADRFRAPAYALAGRKDEARRDVAELLRHYPDLTITEVRSALPHTLNHLDRVAEGLEAAGLRP
jgi:AraC-like DNA-binding protein/tetratricopeptide (TPR) repeat protein